MRLTDNQSPGQFTLADTAACSEQLDISADYFQQRSSYILPASHLNVIRSYFLKLSAFYLLLLVKHLPNNIFYNYSTVVPPTRHTRTFLRRRPVPLLLLRFDNRQNHLQQTVLLPVRTTLSHYCPGRYGIMKAIKQLCYFLLGSFACPDTERYSYALCASKRHPLS